jgi:PAS domain S-box-containing protein
MHRALFELNPHPIWVYDRATFEIFAANEAAQAVYGYSGEEFCSMKTTDLLPAEDVQAYLTSMESPPELGRRAGPRGAGTRKAAQRRHRYKDGRVAEVEATYSDVLLDGRACRIVLSQNVTERNLVAAQLAAVHTEAVETSNLKSAFLANVGHEIRTPMNAVVGMTALLLESELDADQRSLADEVARSGGRMVELINDILDVSRIEAGQLSIAENDFDLRATMEQACTVARIQARSKDVELAVRLAPSVPHRARGDSRRLRQVLASLVANAVKFTIEGTVAVEAGCSANYGERDMLHIEVLDTGIGIEQSTIAAMFEPFTQADASTTRAYGGPGLGLAIARELTELMGGTIGAESRLGHGSRFWIDLPIVTTLEAGKRPSGYIDGADAATMAWSTAPRVLVAEDSPVNQAVAVRMLERCGCQVDVAFSGTQALAMLSARRYDAVLMDCQMPQMDGYDATAEQRRRETGDHHTPIIALTAHAMEGDRERCLESGMDDYMSKPIRRDVLTETLRRWLPAQAS